MAKRYKKIKTVSEAEHIRMVAELENKLILETSYADKKGFERGYKAAQNDLNIATRQTLLMTIQRMSEALGTNSESIAKTIPILVGLLPDKPAPVNRNYDITAYNAGDVAATKRMY